MKRLLSLLLVMMAALMPAKLWAADGAAEPYAVLSDNNTVLTFYYDDQKTARNGISVGPFTSESAVSWANATETITTAEFDSSFANYYPTSASIWFYGCRNLTTINGIENLKTDQVTDMIEMFSGCSSLTTLDLSAFNTANVTNMSHMFLRCTNLKTIYVGDGWTTASVTESISMFTDCSNLVGGAGTTYNANHIDHTYAHIDGGTANPGYFTDKNATLAGNAEPYAVLSDNNTVLTFYYDDQKTARGGMSVGSFYGYPDYQAWYAQRESITTAIFDSSFANCTSITSTAYWFYGCKNMTSISGLQYLNTANVTSMISMFYRCSGLTSIDVSNFNTANVTDMSFMFSDCSGLTSLDLSNFNTANVTGMSRMFDGCSGLTSIDVSNFNTANVTDMSYMFSGCSGLTSLDLSNFNTANVKYMGSMFYGCSGLTSLDLSNFNTANVTGMSSMFDGCSGLTSLDLSNFNTANVTSMSGMFWDCSSLTSLDLSNFNTANVTRMGYMFSGCSGLTSLDLSNFNTANVTSMMSMFSGCSGLTSLDLSNFNTANVTDMRWMFSGCSGLKTIYAGEGWSTAAVTSGGSMFTNCSDLVGGAGTKYDESHIDYTYAHIDGGTENPGYFTRSGDAPYVVTEPEPYAVLSDNNTVLTFYYDTEKTVRGGMSVGPFSNESERGWYESKNTINTVVFDPSFAGCTTITSTRLWFYGCQELTTMTGLENLNTDNVTEMRSMFSGCLSLTSLDLSSFNTANVTTMYGMFDSCTRLTSLNLSGLNTENVTDMRNMFNICRSLTSLDLSSFNTANVTNMEEMFSSCGNLTSIDLSSFNTANVRSMRMMFSDCSALTSLDLSSFNTANVTAISTMFYNCSALTTIYAGSEWSTAAVNESANMFEGCTNLVGGMGTAYDANHVEAEYAHIDGGTANPGYFTDKNATPAVAEAYAVLSDNNTVLTFYYDTEKQARNGMDIGPFSTLDDRGWNYETNYIGKIVFDESFANNSAITSTAYWFAGMNNMTAVEGLRYLNSQNVTNMNYMFWNCSSLTSLDLSEFSMQNVTNMEGMFSLCSGLKALSLRNANAQQVTDMSHMFDGCTNLVTVLFGDSFNTTALTNMYAMFQNCSSLKGIDLSNFNTANVTIMGSMFNGCSSLVFMDISSFSTAKVIETGGMFQGCTSLASIQAGSAVIPAEEYARVANPNLLVYVNEASLAPSGVQNVVVNGQAREIVLTDAKEGNNNFFVPQAFTAERISYTRNFGQTTQVGVSRGWESIALPFNVQTITHEEKGVIAPFGSTASSKHFWLRRLGSNGLQAVTNIVAYTPYVISMPNSSDYTDSYNLAGRVTFAAQNTQVPATELVETSLADASIVMMPAMQRQDRSSAVWALNVGEVRGRYLEGSVFERDYREVRPFEAYTVHRQDNSQPAPRYVPVMEIGGTTGISEMEEIRSKTDEGWYTTDGRKLQGKPIKKGVYIHQGQKIVVR